MFENMKNICAAVENLAALRKIRCMDSSARIFCNKKGVFTLVAIILIAFVAMMIIIAAASFFLWGGYTMIKSWLGSFSKVT